MARLFTNISKRVRNIQEVIPSGSDWSIAVFAAILVLLPALLKWLSIDILPMLFRTLAFVKTGNNPIGYGTGFGSVFSANDPLLRFAFVVAAFCLTISTFLLIISFFVYLFSANEQRSEKAGKITRRTLTFLITSCAGVFGYLGFTAKP